MKNESVLHESTACRPVVGSTWVDWDGDKCVITWIDGDMADLFYDDGSTWHAPWAEVLTKRADQ